MKVVINKCYGGFGLSDEGFERFLELKGIKYYKWKHRFGGFNYSTVPKEEYFREDGSQEAASYLSMYSISRTDPCLIQVVEEMGRKAESDTSKLKVVEIPDDVSWQISEYDGLECIEEVHRTWG